jgi:ferric-dicitrate binding protein FerR (iron transport regulator)
VTDRIDGSSLIRYVSGACDPAEAARIAEWIAASPENRAEYESVRAIWGDSAAALSSAPVDAISAWQRYRNRFRRVGSLASPSLGGPKSVVIARSEATKQSPARPGGLLRPQLRGLAMTSAVAACAVLIAVLVRASYRAQSPSRQYATAAGEEATLTLTDGTRITLAPESHLRVPIDYGNTARAVELEGEGYFAVVHDPARPFSVRAGRALATDIGTAFDVRSYATDRDVRIAVAEGRVGLQPVDASSSSQLGAGDIAHVQNATVAITRGGDVNGAVAWTRGELRFVDAPVSTVVRELERWYGLTVVLDDPALAAIPVTATFDAERHGDDAFNTLARLLHVSYTHDGTRVTFHRGAAQ